MIQLRTIVERELAVFFAHQREREACRIAAFSPRDRAAFFSHWKNNILADDSVSAFAIDVEEQTAGYVLSWKDGDRRLIGFWLGQAFWNQGIATSAVSDYLRIETERQLYAHVAEQNIASIRVLDKCGFVVVSEESSRSKDTVAEVLLRLMEPQNSA